jgi:hypothetical protein
MVNPLFGIRPENPAEVKPEATYDPFDLANLRVDPSYIEAAGVKKLLTTVPIRNRPNPQDFVRVHPAPNYRELLPLIEFKEDREDFLVAKQMAGDLSGEFAVYQVFTAITKQGVVFLWKCRVPDPDGKTNEWNRSRMVAAEKAMTKWMRVKANMSLGAYDLWEAQATFAEPEWPDLPFDELLRVAFREPGVITDPNHPVVKRLRSLT